MILLSDSRTFLYLTPEWAGVIVSVFALFFAWRGYRQLIKSKSDTEAQIKSLADQATETAKVAIHMSELAHATRQEQDAARINSMPWFKFEKYDLYGINKSVVSITLRNVGESSALHVRMSNAPGNVGTLLIEKFSRVPHNETIKLIWEGEEGPHGLHNRMVEGCIWFSDSYGARYVQRIHLLRNDYKLIPPQRSDDPNNLLPPYMKEEKAPTVWD